MNDLYKIDLNEIKHFMLYTTNTSTTTNKNTTSDLKYTNLNIDEQLIENKKSDIENNDKKLKKLASIDYNKMQRKYNEKKKLFYQDKLFWCFYKLYKNMEDVDIENLNIMKEEKDFKINIVNKIHNNKETKDLLKKYKFKKNFIEDELLNNKSITLNTFECLVMLHSMNVFIIKNSNTYTYFNYNNNDNDNDNDKGKGEDESDDENEGKYNSYEKFKNYNFITLKNYSSLDNKFEIIIEENVSNLFINNILENYYYLENLDKPIKAFSSYKLDDLIIICNKLNINIYNINSKKKTKKQLYEEIDKYIR